MKIIYSDKDILVVVKPSGVLSTDEPGGMPALLREELRDGNADIRTVHRLDRVVGGLMVFARSQVAAASLSRQITEKHFRKEYLAVVHGTPSEPEGLMEDLLFRDSKENKTYVVRRMRKGVREAALEYWVLAKKNGLSLVKIHLITGRTHQIRAQFSSRSMPLVGDRKYGAAEDGCETALWSSGLSFRHPRTGKQMEFSLEPSGGYPWSEFGFLGEPNPSVRDAIPAGLTDHSIRKEAYCPYKGECGGCQLLDLPYEKQLQKKQERLRHLLGEFCEVLPIIGMENPYHYRNKSQAAFGVDKKGRIISGTYQAASHNIVPIDSCLLEDELSDGIISDIRRMMPEFKLTAYNERREQGFLRHVLVKRSFSTGQVMVVLVVAQPVFKAEKPFVRALLKKHPEISTIIMNINSAFTPVVLGREEKILFGPGYIEDLLCGYRFRISSRSFYQINPVQTEKLYRTAIDFADLTGKETALDAYCGTGTIGITASSRCASVAGVEINKDAVRDAIINAKTNGVRNIWFTCGDAGEFMSSMADKKEHCSVVFMDPPRTGSDEKFLSSLLKLKPDRVVYVSCGPDTLARDLKILTAGGYAVRKIQPVDMFPHTDHVETVVQLSKGDIDRDSSERKSIAKTDDIGMISGYNKGNKAPETTNVKIDFSLENLDLSELRGKATYEQIKDYVREQTGFRVSTLYISQVKRKCGLEVGESYNKPKSEDAKQPQCTPEKEAAIMQALRHYGMI